MAHSPDTAEIGGLKPVSADLGVRIPPPLQFTIEDIALRRGRTRIHNYAVIGSVMGGTGPRLSAYRYRSRYSSPARATASLEEIEMSFIIVALALVALSALGGES